jgi:hypothetical protein
MIAIISITYYLRNFCKCFDKHFLGSLILLIGLSFSFLIPLSISRRIIESRESEIKREIGSEYRVFIFPKSYPFEDKLKIIFKNKDKYISIVIDDKDFDVPNLLNQITPIKSNIQAILKD